MESAGHLFYPSSSVETIQQYPDSGQLITVPLSIPHIVEIDINPPVYVKTTSDGNELMCRTKIMIVDKPYLVKWEGHDVVVIKTRDSLEFYEAVEKDE